MYGLLALLIGDEMSLFIISYLEVALPGIGYGCNISDPLVCILRSLADSDAFQSGRCAAHNGRPETLAIIN